MSLPALRRLIEPALGTLACVVLGALVLLTLVDVIGRYAFNTPVSGGFELTELMVAALVFIGLPMTTERREHVEVELLSDQFGERGQTFLRRLGAVISALMLAVLAVLLAREASAKFDTGAVTNSLGVPLGWLGVIGALSCAASAVIAALQIVFPATEPLTD